jgi:GTPase SAR1 family protein
VSGQSGLTANWNLTPMVSFGTRRVRNASGLLFNHGDLRHSQLYHRSVTRSYYRGAAGAILVYDITKSVAITLRGAAN